MDRSLRMGLASSPIWISGLLAACTVSAPRANPLDPFFPTPMSPAQQPQHSGEQAEVATVVSETQFGQQTVVAAYRYTGSHNLPGSGLLDITYGVGDLVVIRNGASISGYSVSSDGGVTWLAPGKIYPHSVPEFFGDPIAVLWSDPSLMAGFKKRRLVAYGALAISEAAFDAARDSNGVLHDFPSASKLIDSVCLALSGNGGSTFPNLYCKTPTDIGALGTDQPAVGIDKNDRLFMAVDDFDNKQIDLYQLFFMFPGPVVFNQLVVDSQMGTVSKAPRIARDQDGELWLAAGGSTADDVRLCHIRPALTAFGTGSCDFVGVVTKKGRTFPVLFTSNLGPIRTGLAVSFAANRFVSVDPSVLPLTDLYFAYQTFDATKVLHTGATVCRVREPYPFTCMDVPAWGTDGTASGFPQQMQPALDLVAAPDGTNVDVEYAFYEMDSSNIAKGHARVRRAVLHGSPFGGPAPTATFEDLPLAWAPAVCVAKGYGGGNTWYWGDFFGFRLIPSTLESILPARHLAVYSSDDREGCPANLQTNKWQGRELHVVSWFWPN